MQYNEIKGIFLSKIGYGGWGAGLKGWNVNEKIVVESIEEALKWGINYFDTSPIYGFGKSEEIFGRLLEKWRKYVVLSTKFGLILENGKVVHKITEDSLMFELDLSLKRLKTDYIDIYFLHWPKGCDNFEKIYEKLNNLKDQKVIRFWGVSNYDYEQLKVAYQYGVDFIQNCFNLIKNDDLNFILPFCIEKNIGYIAYSPLMQGLLTDKIDHNFKLSKRDIRNHNEYFKDREKFEKVLDYKKNFRNVTEFALDYVINTRGVVSTLVTMTKKEHIIKNCEKYV